MPRSDPAVDSLLTPLMLPPERRKRREFVKGVGALAGSAALLGYDSKSLAAEPQPETSQIRFVNVPAVCIAPQYLAEELLRLEGFTDVQYINPENETAPSMLGAGKADISMWDVTATIGIIDQGKPVVVLAGIHAGCFELFANSRIKSIRELKGKRISTTLFGNGDQLFLASMLSYIGLNPSKDVTWLQAGLNKAMPLFIEGKADAFLGFAPQPQELRRMNVGHVLVNTAQDRPWSNYFCCTLAANRDFTVQNPIATKRAVRAVLKAADICSRDPERVAHYLVEKGYEPRYDIGLEVLKSLPYNRWRQSDPEDTLRFHAVRLHEVGMIKTNPQKLIAQGTDWRFLNELKKELKA